jgi:hypothetical protein
VYKKYSYDEVKKMLHDYINPQEQPSEEVIEVKKEQNTEEPPFDGPYKSAADYVAPAKNSVASKFDDLFGEEEN